jgi:hypothetical protein
MNTLTKLFRVVLMVGAGTASLAPSAFSSEGLRPREARCATCCREEGSTCVAGGVQNANYYYKESGPCQTPPPDTE